MDSQSSLRGSTPAPFVIPFTRLPSHILLQILVKMKWTAINRARKTTKWMLQFISDNWHVIVRGFHYSALYVVNHKLYTRRYFLRNKKRPLSMNFEGFRGLEAGRLSVIDKNWDSRRVNLIETMFTIFDIKKLAIWSPKLPYTADLFERIYWKGQLSEITLNCTWKEPTWSRALPAIHNATYLWIKSCLDFSFLSEKVKMVNMSRLTSETVKNYIEDCRHGKIKPAPYMYIDMVDRRVLDKLGTIPHKHFICSEPNKQHLCVVALPNSEVLGIVIERDSFGSYYTVGIAHLKSIEEAKKRYLRYGLAMRLSRDETDNEEEDDEEDEDETEDEEEEDVGDEEDQMTDEDEEEDEDDETDSNVPLPKPQK